MSGPSIKTTICVPATDYVGLKSVYCVTWWHDSSNTKVNYFKMKLMRGSLRYRWIDFLIQDCHYNTFTTYRVYVNVRLYPRSNDARTSLRYHQIWKLRGIIGQIKGEKLLCSLQRHKSMVIICWSTRVGNYYTGLLEKKIRPNCVFSRYFMDIKLFKFCLLSWAINEMRNFVLSLVNPLLFFYGINARTNTFLNLMSLNCSVKFIDIFIS